VDTEVDKGFVNDVGQISLKALERNSRNRKRKTDSKSDTKKAENNATAADNLSRPHRQQKGQSNSKQQQQARGPKPNGPKPPAAPKAEGQQPEKNPRQGQSQQPRGEGQKGDGQTGDGQKREGRRPPRNRGRGGDRPKPSGESGGGGSEA
jgi:transcription termination factor Rho